MKIIELHDKTVAVSGFDRALEEFERTLQSRVPPAFKSLHECGQLFEAGNETALLRRALILEECLELSTALQEENLEQVLKEACDVLYVVLAIFALYNLNLFEAFRRVHHNNMNKIVNGTVREDGKLIKPPNHPKVDLSDLVKDKEVLSPK